MGSFNYNCDGQIDIFDLTMPQFKISNKIRLIELFAGYGSQAMALEAIGADFEHYKAVEFDKYAVQSYNAVHGTNFDTTDIRDIHGKDLEICDTDKYNYFLTYSFPCTDLSVAGKMQGMKKGSGTRSGLLWEVERILQELKDGQGELPQVLFMENVPQVISSANISDFHAWQDFLTSLGYTSHVDTLNAKDYGVAQNRERTYMFSFLGEYNYKFPNPIPLTKTMKDYLEDEVDEKYYINSEKANKLIEQLIDNGDLKGCVGNVNPSGNGMNGNVYSGDLAPTLTTNKGEGNKIVEVNQIGDIADENNFENPQTGRVYATDGCSPTLNTCSGGSHESKICIDLSIKNPSENNIVNCITSRENRGISNQQSVGNGVIVAMRGRNPDNPSDRTVGSPTEQRLEPNSQGTCNTITSVQKDNLVLESAILTPKRTEYGKEIRKAYESGAVKESRHNMTQLEPRTDGISNTLTTVQKDNMVLENRFYEQAIKVFQNNDCKEGDTIDAFNEKVNKTGVSPTITTRPEGLKTAILPVVRAESIYRIRKLTPRECGRLMAVSDRNIDKILSVVSNSQAYKQFGNSIVVNCMVAMFSNLNIQNCKRWNEIKDRY